MAQESADNKPESRVEYWGPEPPADKVSVLGKEFSLILVEVSDGNIDTLGFSDTLLVLELVNLFTVWAKVVSENEEVDDGSDECYEDKSEWGNDVDSGNSKFGLFLLGEWGKEQWSDEY